MTAGVTISSLEPLKLPLVNKPHTPPDKRQLIADGLLAGKALADIRADMILAGISPAAADYEIKRAEKDPFAATAARLARRLAKRDWLLASLGSLASGQSSRLQVATVGEIAAGEFFDRFHDRNLPVLLKGAADHWPARGKWSFDYIDRQCGDALIELQTGRETANDYEMIKDQHRSRALLHDVIERIRRGPSNDFYVTAYNGSFNRDALAKLWDDIGTLPILSNEHGGGSFLWLGPQGTLTPFHHDLTNNLLVQLIGRKRLHLVASWHLPKMRNNLHCFSGLGVEDLGSPGAPPHAVIELAPGDALFLPLGWWHHVEALDPSVSVSFTNFARPNNFVGGYPADGRF